MNVVPQKDSLGELEISITGFRSSKQPRKSESAKGIGICVRQALHSILFSSFREREKQQRADPRTYTYEWQICLPKGH
jgi:hypothetical protein